ELGRAARIGEADRRLCVQAGFQDHASEGLLARREQQQVGVGKKAPVIAAMPDERHERGKPALREQARHVIALELGRVATDPDEMDVVAWSPRTHGGGNVDEQVGALARMQRSATDDELHRVVESEIAPYAGCAW